MPPPLWSLVVKKKKRLLWLLHLPSLRPLLLLPTRLPPPLVQHLPLPAQQKLPPVQHLLLWTQPRPLKKRPRSKLTLAALQPKKPPSGGFFSSAPRASSIGRTNVGQAELSLLWPEVGGHAGISKIKLVPMDLPQDYD